MLLWNYLHWKMIFHLLLVNVAFLYPWKEQKSNVFVIFTRGIKRETLESNELSSEKVFDWRWFSCYKRNESILKYWVTSDIFRLLGEIEVNWNLKNIIWMFVEAFQRFNCSWLLMLDFTYEILLLIPSLCLSFKHFGRKCKMFVQDLF